MSGRTVILAGASGLVGGEILRGLLSDPSVSVIHCLGRRPPPISDPKIVAHIVDMGALPALPPADELYLALGTTIKTAGSRAAFRAVDYDANLAIARAALAAGVNKIALVSAMGADPGSRIFYNRVKGELEQALLKLPCEAIVIARPSLLLGDRATLGQPRRCAEQLGAMLARLLRPLIPADYRPIAAADVAAALLQAVPAARATCMLPTGVMQGRRHTWIKASL